MEREVDQSIAYGQLLWILCIASFIIAFITASNIINSVQVNGENLRVFAQSFVLSLLGLTFGISGSIVLSNRKTNSIE